jgi:outer membrane murein-binding lipoprotein Lpp
MKTSIRLFAGAVLLGITVLLSGCSTSTVQDARSSGVDRRQDRIDARTAGRQERWEERAAREDARAAARFDSW